MVVLIAGMLTTPGNPFAAHQDILRERLYRLLAPLHPALLTDVERALSEKGKLLTDGDANQISPTQQAGTWPLLTLLIAHYIRPDVNLELSASVAISMECYVCALDLLDDIEDDDQTPIMRRLGVARALNASTALLALAQQAILSLREQNASPTLILRLLETMRFSTIEAVTGQHRDLLAEQRPASTLTREECIEIAAGKAGAIMRLACQLGAICADASKRIRQQFADLGMALGIAHQLDNDAHDLYYLLRRESPQDTASDTAHIIVKSDLLRGKKTLPVVLAALGLADKGGIQDRRLDGVLKNLFEMSDRESEEYRWAIHEGIIATWGISLLYREHAHACLQEIEVRKPIATELRLLLGFESSP
jgi:geranylgeranyl pyrophosphate synthase